MLVKITLLFLLGMALLAMIGGALFPAAFRRAAARRVPGLCPECGRYRIGKGDCACGAKRKT